MSASRTIGHSIAPAVGTWNFDPAHSHIAFTVRHLVVGKTRGSFGSFTGTVEIADDPTESSVDVTIEGASFETGDANRDGHIKSPDFLDVAKYPQLTFRSTSVTGSGTEWSVVGDLTIAGVTRPVELALELEGVVEKDPWGFSRAAFSGRTEINREDFGLTWNAPLEAGGVVVGKSVKIEFDVETVLAV